MQLNEIILNKSIKSIEITLIKYSFMDLSYVDVVRARVGQLLAQTPIGCIYSYGCFAEEQTILFNPLKPSNCLIRCTKTTNTQNK